MLALQIPDVKAFMSQLLIGDTFDAFLLKEAEITTSVTHSIDGFLHPDFFDETDFSDDLIAWRDIKPHCFSIIRGKRTPLHFSFVFRLNKANIEKLLDRNRIDLRPEQVAGLYLNCKFDGKRLLCTSGTALTIFTLDKRIDQLWDDMLIKFFQQHKIFFVQS